MAVDEIVRRNLDFRVYFSNVGTARIMIASVVATLTDDVQQSQSTLDDIVARPEIEIGEVNPTERRIPLTIDSPDRNDVESVTRWLQEQPGVVFVDVVFVHFEETDGSPRSEMSHNDPTDLKSELGRR